VDLPVPYCIHTQPFSGQHPLLSRFEDNTEVFSAALTPWKGENLQEQRGFYFSVMSVK